MNLWGCNTRIILQQAPYTFSCNSHDGFVTLTNSLWPQQLYMWPRRLHSAHYWTHLIQHHLSYIESLTHLHNHQCAPTTLYNINTLNYRQDNGYLSLLIKTPQLKQFAAGHVHSMSHLFDRYLSLIFAFSNINQHSLHVLSSSLILSLIFLLFCFFIVICSGGPLLLKQKSQCDKKEQEYVPTY